MIKGIKALIADDQKLLRESLKTIIETDPDIKVVGCAGNGREAFDLCGEFLPDVVLMDLRMPECDGVEGTKLIKSKFPSTRIIALTTFEDEATMSRVIENGADGYITKDVAPEELIRIIKSAAEGFLVFSRKTEGFLLKSFGAGQESVNQEQKPAPEEILKKNELEILQLIAEGKSNRAIAEKIFLSEGRVKNIISEILSKLGLKDRYELLSYAYKNNMIR